MSDFWACAAAEIKALGMGCVVHGPEIWFAFAIWSSGAAFGMIIITIAVSYSNKRSNNESISSYMDYSFMRWVRNIYSRIIKRK